MGKQSFQEIKASLQEWVKLDYIQPEDIPSIELYMDQITTFMDSQLGGNKRNAEEKILTKTMINNYSKNALLPPSDKKKYSKDHIILLIYIYYLKNFLSISDIQNLLLPMSEQYFHSTGSVTMSTIYQDLFALEQQYGIRVRESIEEVYTIADKQFDDADDYLKTFAMITMLSYDIYAKKQLVEKLIDSLHDAPVSKEQSKQKQKEEKELLKQKQKDAKDAKKSSKPQ